MVYVWFIFEIKIKKKEATYNVMHSTHGIIIQSLARAVLLAFVLLLDLQLILKIESIQLEFLNFAKEFIYSKSVSEFT